MAGKKGNKPRKRNPPHPVTADTPLTPNEERFVAAMLTAKNKTQAAIEAGYSKKTAPQQASRLLKKVNVFARLTAAREGASAVSQVDAGYVLGNLREVVERCMQRAPVMRREGRALVQATDEDGKAVWDFDAKGAIGALNLLGKNQGLWKDQEQPPGTNVNITIEQRREFFIQLGETLSGHPEARAAVAALLEAVVCAKEQGAGSAEAAA